MTTTTITPVQAELNLTPVVGKRSCLTCPSAMSSSEVQAATGKAIGAPACGQFLVPLVRPDQGDRVRMRVLEKTASICKEYGQPRPEPHPGALNAPLMYGPVGIGMPVRRPSDEDKVKPGTCLTCVNYVAPNDVASETGWSAGLCLAKGRLLTPDRLRTYARSCSDAVQIRDGEQRATLDKFMFNPEFTPNFGEVDRSILARKIRNTDPSDWPTDKPVTSADEAAGIKSWRKISDPEGYGADVYLPVFNIQAIEEDDRELIPRTGDEEHPELYRDHDGTIYKLAVLTIELNTVPAAWGPPGVGKTEIGRHLAWQMAMPFSRISITAQSDIDDIAGKMLFTKEKGTHFVEGRLPRRWRRIGLSCLDEPNVGPPEVWQFIRPLTDNSKQMVLDMSDDHRRIIKNKWSLLYLAMNPAWDARNVGTNTIGDADGRRLMHISMGYPEQAVEMDIIKDHCMTLDSWDPTPHLKNLMKISAELRPMCDSGALPMTWGPAINIKIARLLKWFSPIHAFEIGMTSFIDPRVASTLMKSVKSVYPST